MLHLRLWRCVKAMRNKWFVGVTLYDMRTCLDFCKAFHISAHCGNGIKEDYIERTISRS